MNLGLFDKAPSPLTPKVKETPEKVESKQAFLRRQFKGQTPPPIFGPDVKRAIEHKVGPFRRISRGDKLVLGSGSETFMYELILTEYRYLELINGVFVMETTTGERRPARWIDREMVEFSLRSGVWREVWRG